MLKIIAYAVWYASLLSANNHTEVTSKNNRANDSSWNLNQIIEAWQAREEKYPYGQFSWNWSTEGIHRWRGNQSVWVDSNSSLRPAGNRLLFDRTQVRYETSRWLCDPRLRFDSKTTNQFDVVVLREFEDTTLGQLPLCRFRRIVKDNTRSDLYMGNALTYSRGNVQSLSDALPLNSLNFQSQLSSNTDCDSLGYAPLLLHYQILNSCEVAFSLGKATLLEEVTCIQGQDCLCVVEVISQSDPKIERWYWVDPNRGFSILRYQGKKGGQTVSQLDIQYKEHAKKEWTPTSWTVQLFNKQHDRWPIFMKAVVLDYELDTILAESFFREEWPENAIVYDQINQDYLLVRGSGNRRGMRWEELSGLISESHSHKYDSAHAGKYLFALMAFMLLLLAAYHQYTKNSTPQ